MKLFLISLFFLPVVAASQLQVAKIFSDNMVLQRGQPVHIWEKDIPGKNGSLLTLSYNGKMNLL